MKKPYYIHCIHSYCSNLSHLCML